MDTDIPSRPKIVCLCGSSRFVDRMAVLAWELEKQGAIALGINLLPQWYQGVHPDHQAEHESAKEKLDELHLRKIDLADLVLVCNFDGYIGESTKNEIAYARKQGKAWRFLECQWGDRFICWEEHPYDPNHSVGQWCHPRALCTGGSDYFDWFECPICGSSFKKELPE